MVKVLHWTNRVSKVISAATVFFITLLITVSVISRALGFPIFGDTEIVELSMVVLVIFGLVFSQTIERHLSIGLIVDRLPQRIQTLFDMLGLILIIIISWIIGFVFFGAFLEDVRGIMETSLLLKIPVFYFKIIISFGFFLWGFIALLQCLVKVPNIIKSGKGSEDRTVMKEVEISEY